MRVSAALLLEKMIAEPAVSFHYCGHGDWRLHGGGMLCCTSGRPVAAVTALRTSVNYPLAISCWRFFGGTNEKTRRPGAILTITTFSRSSHSLVSGHSFFRPLAHPAFVAAPNMEKFSFFSTLWPCQKSFATVFHYSVNLRGFCRSI